MKWVLSPGITVMVYLLMPQCQAFIVIESTIMVNEALKLPCNCSGNCPVVLWFRSSPGGAGVVAESWKCSKQQFCQERFTLPGDTSRGNFSLTISSVTYNDSGSYKCRCNGKLVTKVKLKVIKVNTDVKPSEGKNVTLSCY